MRNVFLTIRNRKISLNNFIVTATTVAIIVGLTFPADLVQGLITPAACLLLLAGIPHGASDFIIYQNVNSERRNARQVLSFFVSYFVIIGLYLIVWWFSPLLAFIFFLLNSIYHFGESNWNYLYKRNATWASIISVLWGIAVVGIPVLINFEEAAFIIAEITGLEMEVAASTRAGIVFLILGANLSLITILLEQELLSSKEFYREIRHFLLLTTLFFCTPLLIGFGIYFLFWHSTYAMKDHFEYLRLNQSTIQRKRYFLQLFLFSTIAIAGLGLLYLLFGNQMNIGPNLGKLFVFIAVLTVPHSLLMHQLYQINLFRKKKKIAY